jgi:hypothetical protein
LILCVGASIAVAACDDGQWGYYGYGGGRYRPYTCGQYTSCGSCTPVLGCGWCSFEGGGACLSDPDACGASAFSWTWEPSGCGTLSSDGGPGGARSDAGTQDAATSSTPGDAAADR